ncbi:SPOSA6832_01708, partial [Sporobolomyces salmonicolor]
SIRLPPSPALSSSGDPPPPASVSRTGRLRPGTRSEDTYDLDPFSPPPRFESFDSSFAVQEYIAALVRRDPHDVDLIATLPVATDDEEGEQADRDGDEPVELVEENVWLYEHLRCAERDLSLSLSLRTNADETEPTARGRRITLDQHAWIAALSSRCTRLSCPDMRADDWLCVPSRPVPSPRASGARVRTPPTRPPRRYICAAHAAPPCAGCSAIDYCSHASDGASALLTSPRYFPSRISIVGAASRGRLHAVARRLYRSFAHAFFHHHDVFAELESETSLLRRFMALNDRFGLMDEDMLVIPNLVSAGERDEVSGVADASDD